MARALYCIASVYNPSLQMHSVCLCVTVGVFVCVHVSHLRLNSLSNLSCIVLNVVVIALLFARHSREVGTPTGGTLQIPSLKP